MSSGSLGNKGVESYFGTGLAVLNKGNTEFPVFGTGIPVLLHVRFVALSSESGLAALLRGCREPRRDIVIPICSFNYPITIKENFSRDDSSGADDTPAPGYW